MKKIILPLFLLFFLNATACSIILKNEGLKAEVANTNWTNQNYNSYYQYLKFERQNVSLDVRSGFAPSRELMWIGPPVIPVIPRYLYKQPPAIDYDIRFTINLDSLYDKTFIDLSHIKGLTSSGKVLSPSSIRIFVGPEPGEKLSRTMVSSRYF
jgi:hypothetical protein